MCHETTRRAIRCTGRPGVSLDDSAVSVYTRLLFPFVDVFCFFSADLGGFKQIACHVAAWLEKGSSSILPKCTYLRVIIVSDKILPGAEMEKEARKSFLWLLEEETIKDLFEQISAIDIVAFFPAGTMSDEARHRPLKERLIDGSD